MKKLVSLLALFAVLAACATNPVTGRRSLQLVPESQMQALGLQAYQQVMANARVSTDARKTEIVRRVANRIAAVTHKDYAWEVNLIDSNEANAFVLPGGKIVVYSGILPICENEAGLAFVLGHEVGHAVARHGGERVSQSLVVEAGLTAADLSLRNNSQRGLIMAALGVGTQYGVMLPFSRDNESEADHMGIVYMAEAGYDPTEAPKLWQRMAASGGQQPPEFLSTHPSHATRIRRLNDLLPKALSIYKAAEPQYGLGERL